MQHLFYFSENEILFYSLEAEIDLESVDQQHVSCLSMNFILMLFSALAVSVYYKSAADLTETLFKWLTAELSTFMSKSIYDIAVTLYLQQVFAVDTDLIN